MTVIGLDVDDTCLDLVSPWLNEYNVATGDNLKLKDIKTWDIASYAKRMKKEDFYKLLTPKLYDFSKPIKGALAGVRELRTMGRVIFVTSNFGNIGPPKFEALNRLGFEVEKKDFFEALDKSLIACHFLFDDNYDNVRTAFGQGVLFSRPWNMEHNFTPRVKDWTELIDFMRGDFA